MDFVVLMILLMAAAGALGVWTGIVVQKNKKEPEMIEVDDEIVEVRYVSSNSTIGLTKEVNQLIEEGFEPADRVVPSGIHNDTYVQIMVRYD